MFKFRNSIEKKKILPSIEISECNEVLPNEVLLDYEMIRRAREARRVLKRALLVESKKDMQQSFLDEIFPYLKKHKYGFEESIPFIKVIYCEEDFRTEDQLSEELIQQAQIAKLQLESNSNRSDGKSGNDIEDNPFKQPRYHEHVPNKYIAHFNEKANKKISEKALSVIDSPLQMFNMKKHKPRKFMIRKNLHLIDKSTPKLIKVFIKPVY